MKKYVFLIFLAIILFPSTIYARKAVFIDFKILPKNIQTNIDAYPVTAFLPKNTQSVTVNGNPIEFDETGRDIFTVVHLSEGPNEIELEINKKNGKNTHTKTIIYDPDYSTEKFAIVYANCKYIEDDVFKLGIIVINQTKRVFLGVLQNTQIVGVSRDGAEIFLEDGRRFTTHNHAFTGESLPLYEWIYDLVFSNDNQYVYYHDVKLDLDTNEIVEILPLQGNAQSITSDDTKLFTDSGYLDVPTNVFTPVNYPVERAVIEPQGRYLLDTDSAGGIGELRVIDPDTGAIIWIYESDDNAGDIVFIQRRVYVGFYGNTLKGGGRIMNFRLQDTKPNKIGRNFLYGASSLTVAKHEKIFASAFFSANGKTRGNRKIRGIVDIAPTKNSGLKKNRVYFVNLLSELNEPYYGENNLFYKPSK